MFFTDQLWTQGKPLLERMIDHPFNTELATGTLSRAAFHTYLQQDELYIKDYTQALLRLSERADTKELERDLICFAEDGYESENQMHDHFLKLYGIDPAPRKTLACEAYSGFLLNCCANSTLPVALAALLPCFWFYWQVGLSLLDNCAKNNPYQPWINLYSGEVFEQQVRCLLDHVDRLATQEKHQQKSMQDAFITSSLLELAFWNSAYQPPSSP